MSIAEKLSQIAENEQKVFEAGKQKEQSDFWDVYQNKGKQMSNYANAFAYEHWNDINYNPKYDIRPAYSCNMMYYASNITDTKIALNITLCTQMDQVFRSAKKLRIIRKLIVKESSTYNYTFRDCEALEEIIFEGVIGQNIDFSYSPLLKVESMIGTVATEEQIATGTNILEFNGVYYYGGIFIALKDLTGTGETRTCTLGATNLAKLTDEQKAIATDKGWTLA